MTRTDANIYGVLARERKARKLATVIHAAGVTADDVRKFLGAERGIPDLMDLTFWSAAAEKAEVQIPHSLETKELVVQFLKEMEGANASGSTAKQG